MIERRIRFTPEDMALFASASGDRSPLHTDPAFARRTAFGECIVYGGLETLAMLAALPADALGRVTSVRSSFPAPILPREEVIAQARSREDRSEWEVRLLGRGRLLARAVASAECRPPFAAWLDDPPEGEISGDYRVGPALEELVRRFGIQGLDRAVLEGVAWASNVVGTTIPDFVGLCAAVAVVAAEAHTHDGAAARQQVVLRDYDQRTDRLLIEGVLSDGAGAPRCFGLIECLPFGPTGLPASAALSAPDPRSEPVHRSAAVIGGSRGLGGALSLALLAGGYTVHSIYSSSTAAARELAGLAGPYRKKLILHQADASDGSAVSRLAQAIGGPLDGIALCAAPPALPMRLSGQLARYVSASLDLVAEPLAAFLPRLARDRGWVLLCSAPAALEPPQELPQLAVAKAGVEGLARWVAATNPSVRVLIARPPKMRTDLVNTPAARAVAVGPEVVAAEIAKRLAEDEPAGLSILEFNGPKVAV